MEVLAAVLAATLASAQPPAVSTAALALASAPSTAAADVEVTLSAVGDIHASSGPIADIAREGGDDDARRKRGQGSCSPAGHRFSANLEDADHVAGRQERRRPGTFPRTGNPAT